MKFCNLFKYDVRRQLFLNPYKWVVTVSFYAFLFLCFTFDIFHLFYTEVDGIWDINSLSLSFGDAAMFEIGGKLPPVLSGIDTSISFPTSWFLSHVIICYFTLHYIDADLTHGGIQVLIRIKPKCLWWCSKVILNTLSVVLSYTLGFVTFYLLSLLTGKINSFTLNPRLFTVIFSAYLNYEGISNGTMFLYVCVLPCVVGITVNLIQMTLTLYIKPIFAFLFMCVYLIVGMYYAHPILISNYAMPVRSEAIGIYNFNFCNGILICVLLCIVTILVGVNKVRRMDFISSSLRD